MKILYGFISTTLASLAVLASATATLAAPVAATAGVNVRSGPGTNFNVIDTLNAGENAEAVECVQSGWCRVEHNGPTGWVYNTFLGPRANTQNNQGNPANPAQNTQVGACFYTEQGHQGDEYCSGPQTYNTLGGFDNRIRSYKVFGGAHVNFCINQNMSGDCYEGSRSTPTLGGPLDRQASSLSIFTVGNNNQNNNGGFGNQNNNNPPADDNQGNQGNAPANNNPNDPNCSFAIVVGPDGPTFALTCGDNPQLPEQNQGNNAQVNNNDNDPIANAQDRFGNEEVVNVELGGNEDNNGLVLEREPAEALVDENNIADQLGLNGQNNGPGPIVLEILEPAGPIAIFNPGTPDIARGGVNVISATGNINLDQTDAKPDLFYTKNGGNSFIIPGNGAVMGFVTGAQPTYEQCSAVVERAVGSIRRGQYPQGTWFCLKTTGGQLIRIQEKNWNNTAFQFEFEVWENS